MIAIPRLVLASSNVGKLREFRRLLSPLGIEVIAQADLGIEDWVTFTGWVGHEEVAAYLSTADIGLEPNLGPIAAGL